MWGGGMAEAAFELSLGRKEAAGWEEVQGDQRREKREASCLERSFLEK